MFGPKMKEVAVGCKKLRSEELQMLYSTIIRVIKYGRMRWAGHVAHMRTKIYTQY